VYKFMMLSPQDVHVPVAEWERRRGKKKATKSKAGSLRNISPGTQGTLKYQKSLSENFAFSASGLKEKPLDPKLARRARRLKQHLEGVEDYEQNIARWDAAKSGNKEFSDIRIDMLRVGMGIKPKNREKKVKEWLNSMRASEYKFETIIPEDYESRKHHQELKKQKREEYNKYKKITPWLARADRVSYAALINRDEDPERADAARRILIANAKVPILGRMLQGRREKHKFNEGGTYMDYELAEIIDQAIFLGEVMIFEGVEAGMAAAEKPPGRIKRAYNYVQNASYRAKAAAARGANWVGDQISRPGTIKRAVQYAQRSTGGLIKKGGAALESGTIISGLKQRGQTMYNDVRGKLVRKRAEDVINPVVHVPEAHVR